jgi:hypothetical protein
MTNPIYLIEHQGKVGRYFIECDRDTNSRQFAIGLIRSGEVNPVKVLEVVEDEGTCRDVTEEFLHCAKWGDHAQVKTFKRIETPEGVTFQAAE